MCGVPSSTVRAMIRRGQINPVTSFGVWLVPADDVAALLLNRLRPNETTAPHSPAPAGKLGGQHRKAQAPIPTGSYDEAIDDDEVTPT